MAKDEMETELKAAVDEATGLVDMKLTKAESKDRIPSCETSEDKGPKYDYGLEIRLDTRSLKKLGIDKLPSVGDTMKLEANVRVDAVREEEHIREGKESEPDRNVTLQIQKMSLS